MKKVVLTRSAVLLVCGGAIYCCIELLYRRRTHISMFALGGVCLLLIDALCNRTKVIYRSILVIKLFVGSAAVTLCEFLTGVVVNLWLKLGVWDYSGLPFNLLGQICPYFSAAWAVLTYPAILIANLISRCVERMFSPRGRTDPLSAENAGL
ncbi:MAG TPA: hypothetical protein PLT66_08205, partial [Bacillota bacterium]|nr:hypothetical protein [Bacillota bacterium]